MSEDKTAAAEESLRAATREAHEAIKDLRLVIREGYLVIDQISTSAQIAVDERLEPIMVAEIEKLGVATQEAMAASVDKVGKEFDRLESILLGKEKRDIRKGKPTLEQLVTEAGSS